MNCSKCGLPQFFGGAGYAGRQCLCDWKYGPAPSRLTAAEPAPVQCGCIGPQRGQPLCPCAMRGVVVKDGRYVRPAQDLGPVVVAPNVKEWIGS